ncbi:MAG: hypothetical protein LUF34_06770 [Lachnospiraceae bacterium]|nr:hypothetical protein [Lachnospiraceae bacterium]
MARRDSKVIRYRRPVHFNIGMVVFLVIFLYVAVNVISYMTRGSVQIYEVGQTSSVVQDTTYTGLILRSETVYTAPEAGYIHYYLREGTRSSVGDIICSVDTNGEYTELLNSSAEGDSSLSSDELSALKKKLTAFTASYSPVSFDKVYDLKYSLQNLLLSYLGSLEDLAELGIDTDYLLTVTADASGVVEYYTDGYETVTEEDLTLESLEDSGYEKTAITSGTLVEADASLYKMIGSETWSVYLELTEEDRNQLADETSVTLLFNDVNMEVTADFSLVTLSDGNIVGRCTLSDYMVQLADKRFTNVTVKKSAISSLNITGLKIPKSSVVTKDFYVVPVEYATVGGNDSETGFLQETYTADGTTVAFITPTIYASTEDYYFLDPSEIDEGTVLRKPSDTEDYTETEYETVSEETQSSTGTYTIGTTSSLYGVYCVNKGYTVFRQIEILAESDDYYIVAEGQSYGLSVYDHILLNGEDCKEGEQIY